MANTLAINITAIDKATAFLQKINKNVQGLTRPFQNVQRSVQAFGRAAGFDAVKKKLEGLTQTATDVVSAFSRIGAPLLALVGGGTIAGLVALTDGWARFGLQLSQTSQILGVNTQDLYNFQNAARLVGISGEAATQTFSSFADTLQDARWGRNQGVMALLLNLHMQLKYTKAGAIDTADMLGQVADQIHDMQQKDPGAARRFAKELGVTDLLPLLMLGRKGMEAYQAQAAKTAGKIDWNMARTAGLQWEAMNVSMTNAKNTIASALLPTITPLITQFGAWINANKDLIATDLSSFLKGLGRAFEGISLKTVLDDSLALVQAMLSLGSDIADVTSDLGGVKIVLEGLAGLWAADKVLRYGLAFVKVSAWADAARTSLLSYRAASMLETGGPTVASRAATAGAVAARGLSIASLAVPAAAAGIALGAGFDELFPNNWGAQFGHFIGGTLADLGDKFASTHKAQNVMGFFQHHGWTKAQAAGITANIQAESGFNPRAIGDHGEARGIGQWHPERQAAYNAWAASNRKPSLEHAGLMDQLQFFDYELRHSDAGKRLAGATNADEAAQTVSLYDERPAGGQIEAARRGTLATQIAAGDGPPINLSVQTTVHKDGATTTKVQTPSGVKIAHTSPVDSMS